VKEQALRTLASPVVRAGSVAAQVVAAIGAVELPANEWPELIKLLLQFVGDQTNVGLRINTLQALGFLCEAVVRPASLPFSLPPLPPLRLLPVLPLSG
jgi:importin subunit beta-1